MNEIVQETKEGLKNNTVIQSHLFEKCSNEHFYHTSQKELEEVYLKFDERIFNVSTYPRTIVFLTIFL